MRFRADAFLFSFLLTLFQMLRLTVGLNKSAINLTKDLELELELIQACQLRIVIGIVLVSLFLLLLIIGQRKFFKRKSRNKAIRWNERFCKQYEDQRRLIEDHQLIEESCIKLTDRLIEIEEDLHGQKKGVESLNMRLGLQFNQILNFVSASINYSRLLLKLHTNL